LLADACVQYIGQPLFVVVAASRMRRGEPPVGKRGLRAVEAILTLCRPRCGPRWWCRPCGLRVATPLTPLRARHTA